ncbi:MAG UNVERIFIED_CONTAM: hypothetical protein LVR18_24820 [Planctomycetaceae bacterium]
MNTADRSETTTMVRIEPIGRLWPAVPIGCQIEVTSAPLKLEPAPTNRANSTVVACKTPGSSETSPPGASRDSREAQTVCGSARNAASTRSPTSAAPVPVPLNAGDSSVTTKLVPGLEPRLTTFPPLGAP